MKKLNCWLWHLKVGQLKKQWKSLRFPNILLKKPDLLKKNLVFWLNQKQKLVKYFHKNGYYYSLIKIQKKRFFIILFFLYHLSPTFAYFCISEITSTLINPELLWIGYNLLNFKFFWLCQYGWQNWSKKMVFWGLGPTLRTLKSTKVCLIHLKPTLTNT